MSQNSFKMDALLCYICTGPPYVLRYILYQEDDPMTYCVDLIKSEHYTLMLMEKCIEI